MVCVALFGLLYLLFAAGPSSPRIEQLRTKVITEEQFWREAHSPLVEPAPERGASLVTFLYHGGADTRTVVLMGDGTPGAPAANQLARLPGTNVWYRTYVYRSDARFRYSL